MKLIGRPTGGRAPFMRRRQLVLAASAILAFASLARAQQRVYRVAWLSGATRQTATPMRKLLVERLASAGFTEGRNLQLFERYADGRLDRMAQLARELGEHNPDVFIANGTQAVVAASEATRDVPIVFAFVSDPVNSGFVADLGRPAGRVTGFTNMNYELIGKRLEVLREAFPGIEKVAIFHDPQNRTEILLLEHLRKAAAVLKMDLTIHRLAREADFATAFAAMEKRMTDALFVLENASNIANREQIFAFARRHRIPAMYGFESFVEARGLMSYCAPLTDQLEGATDYAAKILRGTKVRDLPVQLPRRIALVINLGEARSSGITFPQSVLLRADRIIE